MNLKDNFAISGGRNYMMIKHNVFPRIILIINYHHKEPSEFKISLVDKCSAEFIAPVLNDIDEIVKDIETFRNDLVLSPVDIADEF